MCSAHPGGPGERTSSQDTRGVDVLGLLTVLKGMAV